MALRDRKFWFGNALLMAALVLLLATAAFAAVQRPNSLDRRVDALTQTTLMTQSATTLVDT
ncbi:MAG TPA: hypothetical protein VGZ06_07725, partial [Candidatus Cybelea sp.]|nr:hypothetical protein [Candidatus Cybelea sp.]